MSALSFFYLLTHSLTHSFLLYLFPLTHSLLDLLQRTRYVLAHHGPAAQNDLAERLFRAYFTDGTCPMGADVLARLAAEALPALSEGEVGACRAHVASGAGEAGARRAAAEVSASGVSGVPMFYFDGAPAFSGAQPEEAFLEAFSRC